MTTVSAPTILGTMPGSVVGANLLAESKPAMGRWMVIGLLSFAGLRAQADREQQVEREEHGAEGVRLPPVQIERRVDAGAQGGHAVCVAHPRPN